MFVGWQQMKIVMWFAFYIQLISDANLQRDPLSKLHRKPSLSKELKFNTKNLNEAAQQEALIKYKRNVVLVIK